MWSEEISVTNSTPGRRGERTVPQQSQKLYGAELAFAGAKGTPLLAFTGRTHSLIRENFKGQEGFIE